MSAKYYTQFILTDTQYRDGNEFSGVVELSQPMDHNTDTRDIEAALARNFANWSARVMGFAGLPYTVSTILSRRRPSRSAGTQGSSSR